MKSFVLPVVASVILSLPLAAEASVDVNPDIDKAMKQVVEAKSKGGMPAVRILVQDCYKTMRAINDISCAVMDITAFVYLNTAYDQDAVVTKRVQQSKMLSTFAPAKNNEYIQYLVLYVNAQLPNVMFGH